MLILIESLWGVARGILAKEQRFATPLIVIALRSCHKKNKYTTKTPQHSQGLGRSQAKATAAVTVCV